MASSDFSITYNYGDLSVKAYSEFPSSITQNTTVVSDSDVVVNLPKLDVETFTSLFGNSISYGQLAVKNKFISNLTTVLSSADTKALLLEAYNKRMETTFDRIIFSVNLTAFSHALEDIVIVNFDEMVDLSSFSTFQIVFDFVLKEGEDSPGAYKLAVNYSQ